MTARLVIQGREAHPTHLLMERIDEIEHWVRALPKGHPDRADREKVLEGLTADLWVHRRKEWARA